MAPFSGDRVLWVCLGVSLVFAVRGIISDLQQVVDLTEIKHAEKEDKIISEGTEEFLKLDTLLRLSECTSYELRSAYEQLSPSTSYTIIVTNDTRALRIISQRSTKGDTRTLLLEDLRSFSKKRQGKALTALHFLVTNRALSRTSVCAYLHDIETFTALVDCLCNFLREHTEEISTTKSPILPKTRPLGELKALQILNVLLPGNVHNALEAGIISRWLNKYPFPCAAEDSPSRREDVVLLMKAWWTDDVVMSSIFDTLSNDAEASKQLRTHGLMGSIIAEHDDDDQDHDERDDDHQGYDDDDDDDGDGVYTDGDVRMVNGEDTAGPDFGAVPLRQRNQDQARRRMRREAMAISDGGRPWARENIIQRQLQDD
ncbi:uncharacterized protein N7496_011040 [Penicillium cataractarum]|uniref:Uncharacterized protein n=1 Tax=Penicillium cataractarum TaxID=2100454 RepID=A0A9W9RE84_9EURO|nr:uncharacterized protein N7496_011040 [Penicillium cataractarum]KAJ5358627.1 hypothetical protein N7496_011040 [Penicillium cataractarum]